MPKTSISPKQFYFFDKRFGIIRLLFTLLFFVLFIRTTFLQIIQGNKYEELALNNKEQYIPIQTYRGEVFDRGFDATKETNTPLITNDETIGVFLLPVHLKKNQVQDILLKLSLLLDFNYDFLWKKFSERANYYEPFLVKENISVEKIAKIAEEFQDYPGVYWEPVYYRNYLNKNFASHVLGYVGKISKEELKLYENDPDYNLNSMIGKMGIEKYYDKELRGKEGRLVRIVDAKNRIKKSVIVERPVSGHNLVLTIDSRIQRIAEGAMENERGAVVILDPNTGEILGLVSKPDFNPNIFIKEPDMVKINKMQNDPNKPFLNKVIQAIYPPGSVFKVITATAGLSEEVVKPEETFYCKGYYKFENDDRVFHCTGYHGYMNSITALQFSCNVYFFNLGYYLGSKKIIEYAKYYGCAEKSGIDLPGEVAGFLPSHRWKKDVFGENWYDGDTINLGIGQGYALTTIIQITDMMAAIANQGLIYRPHLLKAVYSSVDGSLINQTEKKLIHNVPIGEKELRIIQRGLYLVTLAGTAKLAGQYGKVSIAGKTSTAQNIFGAPHAWFSCYAPYTSEKDRVVVTVFLENAGGGGEEAAPIAVAILNALFKNVDVKEEKKKIVGALEKQAYDRFLKRQEQQKMLEGQGDSSDIQF